VLGLWESGSEQMTINPIQTSLTQRIKRELPADEWAQAIIRELAVRNHLHGGRSEEASMLIKQNSYISEEDGSEIRHE
jgi:hypothetical protein